MAPSKRRRPPPRDAAGDLLNEQLGGELGNENNAFQGEQQANGDAHLLFALAIRPDEPEGSARNPHVLVGDEAQRFTLRSVRRSAAIRAAALKRPSLEDWHSILVRVARADFEFPEGFYWAPGWARPRRWRYPTPRLLLCSTKGAPFSRLSDVPESFLEMAADAIAVARASAPIGLAPDRLAAIGRLTALTAAERRKNKLWSIPPIDATPEQLRQEANRISQAARRAAMTPEELAEKREKDRIYRAEKRARERAAKQGVGQLSLIQIPMRLEADEARKLTDRPVAKPKKGSAKDAHQPHARAAPKPSRPRAAPAANETRRAARAPGVVVHEKTGAAETISHCSQSPAAALSRASGTYDRFVAGLLRDLRRFSGHAPPPPRSSAREIGQGVRVFSGQGSLA